MSKFQRAVEMVFHHEGGYVDHPDDPGGATNMGITHKTLAAWRGKPVTKSDVRNLTKREAGEIYRANYWNAVNGDALPAGVDLVVFDYAVNSGVSRAAKALQKLVHVEADGHIGPATIAAVRAWDAAALINGYSESRMGFLRGLRHWPTFGKGWARRVSETRAEAIRMADAAMPNDTPLTGWAALWARLMAVFGR